MAVATATRGEPNVRTRIRKYGHPSEKLHVRCPTELMRAIDVAGGNRSEGTVRLLDRAVDAQTVLGDLWAEVEVRAYREQITEGEALGRWAREAIERERGKGRK